MKKQKFSIFCWNIGNPSAKRAGIQAEWLKKRKEDLIVLTETKKSDGCLLIEKYFKFSGYNVIFPKPENKEYGVMILSKHELSPNNFSVDYIPSRVASADIKIFNKKINLIGTYIPSRDISIEKIKRKKYFLENLDNSLSKISKDQFSIFCGDFNILEPSHNPRYPIFQKWEYDFYNNLINFDFIDAFRYINPSKQEYSWVGRTGNGYRYDHFFVSKKFIHLIRNCYYDHSPRNNRLSDHSAIVLDLVSD